MLRNVTNEKISKNPQTERSLKNMINENRINQLLELTANHHRNIVKGMIIAMDEYYRADLSAKTKEGIRRSEEQKIYRCLYI